MSQSESLFASSQQHIPGGVNSPVRAFAGVGGTPPFIRAARGAWLTDEDDRRYIDYVGSWGPMILGHGHPDVIAALHRQVDTGVSFGAPTAVEAEMAALITELMPSIEQLRMVNSGTEATMTALRLARGVTGRDAIVKFDGCYHGHVDSLLVNAGSGALTLGVPSSPGVPEDLARHTLTLPYNDIAAVEALFSERGEEIAAVIVEPVAGNMNCVPPLTDFLPTLRAVTREHDALLIFDEVMTGFRVDPGGAQALYGVTPDLTTLGKIIGGGLPVGAVGGRRELMQALAPTGPIYQAGTLSGNPLAMRAGLATLTVLKEQSPYAELSRQTRRLTDGLVAAAKAAGLELAARQVGSMFGLFFGLEHAPTDLASVQQGDVELFRRAFHGLLARGIYLAPSAFEAGFVSAAHGDAEIDQTLEAAAAVFAEIAG